MSKYEIIYTMRQPHVELTLSVNVKDGLEMR